MANNFHAVTDAKEEWYTPPHILAALGPFDLDPCFSPPSGARPWDTAASHFSKEQNGLLQPWHGRAFCNPPYGRAAYAWLRKCAEHGNAIALVFARTEIAIWQDIVFPTASGILFLAGRLKFIDGATLEPSVNSSPAGSALIAWGANNLEALRTCGLEGSLVIPERRV